MTYEEAVQFLYTQLPMYSRDGAVAYKADLNNIISLCASLGNPQEKFKTIHIAGTNGKGSTSHMLAAILQTSGLKTGLYTSPHLFDFSERIRINGAPVTREFVIQFVERIQQIAVKIQPSFFEITVAMAFEYFAMNRVDIAVIETGMGGRLDSTNIIQPVMSVITSVGLDHQDILGETLEEIAEEKAGIIKFKTPLVLGELKHETMSIFATTCNRMQSEVLQAEQFATIVGVYVQGDHQVCDYRINATGTHFYLKTDLKGLYQAKNARTVYCCIRTLRKLGLAIDEEDMKNGLENVSQRTGIRGRWEILRHDPLIIADVAHNIDGIQEVMKQLKLQYPDRTCHFILGFVRDKQIHPVLNELPTQANYYFTQAQIPRALPAEMLQEQASKYNLNGNAYPNVNEALEAAIQQAHPRDVIMITGSFFIIAELNFPEFAHP
ncbi:MAG TPA: folylpolyglutamate synthase/dihydrofolate synthase family protein [Ferruginibacter sp.]|nr:folylpolyglutamate synthase/dihydrofolate synthase family protein [Ferruginibacter sp.]HRO16535.1 folylpolyglutamate synthase/dihydrofolate synthase family protein [Ferruginibacter sp.]HRQ19956.1 folylpolyglutamate synthase/dihydrofolate synthase family protein [Ferruginibacter sp.]